MKPRRIESKLRIGTSPHRRWRPALLAGVLCAAAGSATLAGCNIGSNVNVSVKGVADHVKVKKLEVLNEDGQVVLRADADEAGNGRVLIYDADGQLIASVPDRVGG